MRFIGFRQFVGDRQRRHHREPGVADLAELACAARRCAGRASAPASARCSSCPSSQAMRNWRPLMVTLTCAIDCSSASARIWMRVDRGIEPARDLAVGVVEPSGARGLAIERGGKPGAVDAERVNLLRQAVLAAVGLAAALDRGSSASSASARRFDQRADRSRVSRSAWSDTLARSRPCSRQLKFAEATDV